MQKKMRMERKNGEGVVIETPFGDIHINVFKKVVNGRILIALDNIPDECNVYRVNEHGTPQNKRMAQRDSINVTSKKENYS